jgi:hypothetical protein
MEELIYKSMFKGTKELKESKTQKLSKIVESLKDLKKKLREEDDDLSVSTADVTDTTEEKPIDNAAGIASIIDKVEDLVVDAIQTLGVTSDTTTELISTAGALENAKNEEQMIASIDASAKEADGIQEDFGQDAGSGYMGGMNTDMNDLDDEEIFADDDDEYGLDEFDNEEDYGMYEKYVKKFNRQKPTKK